MKGFERIPKNLDATKILLFKMLVISEIVSNLLHEAVPNMTWY